MGGSAETPDPPDAPELLAEPVTNRTGSVLAVMRASKARHRISTRTFNRISNCFSERKPVHKKALKTFSPDSVGNDMTQERRVSLKNRKPNCLSAPLSWSDKACALGSPWRRSAIARGMANCERRCGCRNTCHLTQTVRGVPESFEHLRRTRSTAWLR